MRRCCVLLLALSFVLLTTASCADNTVPTPKYPKGPEITPKEKEIATPKPGGKAG